MKFETIDDVCLEVERRTVSLDSGIAALVYLYKSAAAFVFAINILLLVIILAFIFFTDCLEGYSKLVLVIYACVISFEVLVSTYNRQVIDYAVKDMKFNIANKCFTEYVKYDELEEWEKEKILFNKIIKYSGLSEIKKDDK